MESARETFPFFQKFHGQKHEKTPKNSILMENARETFHFSQKCHGHEKVSRGKKNTGLYKLTENQHYTYCMIGKTQYISSLNIWDDIL